MTWTCEDWNCKPYMRRVGIGRVLPVGSLIAESEFIGSNGRACCRAAGIFLILRSRSRPAH